MSQNIYDDPEFFEIYSQRGRAAGGLSSASEWPATRALLPDLRGLRVLDLGCGFGWFCRWAREQGAAQVLGIDLSENMLARAKALTTDAAITYARVDMERVELPSASLDLACSSLALHYVEDLGGLLAKVYDALVPGGSLVFSVEHPICTAPTNPAWSVEVDGRKTWPVDSYLVEGPRTTDWYVKGVIKQHRTVATYLNLLLRLGFAISTIDEWGPTLEQIATRVTTTTLAEARQRPTFLLVAARR